MWMDTVPYTKYPVRTPQQELYLCFRFGTEFKVVYVRAGTTLAVVYVVYSYVEWSTRTLIDLYRLGEFEVLYEV